MCSSDLEAIGTITGRVDLRTGGSPAGDTGGNAGWGADTNPVNVTLAMS